MLSIIFDIDDTLYHRQDPFSLAYGKLFAERWKLDQSRLFKTFLKYGNALFEDSMNGRISMEDMHIRRIRTAMADFGAYITPEEAAAFQAAYLWEQGHLQLHPAYREMLDYCLDKSVFLGIITNGPSSHQRRKYRALGLTKWIPEDAVLTSGEAGVNKPDNRIFRIAEQKWKLDPAETIYVGNSYEHDILSPKSAGWKTAVWLDRNHEILTISHDAADYIVHTEDELSSCIRKLIAET